MAGGFYTGGGVTVIMDPSPIVYAKVFHSGSGPDRHIRKKTRDVAYLASEKAPFKSGHLKGSIRVDQNRTERGRFAFGYRVYSKAPYAGYVHEGTDPSVRYGANTPNGRMKFRGTNMYAGDYVFPYIVFHPGTPAQPFLQNALIALVGP
jgi:hypothetical protein